MVLNLLLWLVALVATGRVLGGQVMDFENLEDIHGNIVAPRRLAIPRAGYDVLNARRNHEQKQKRENMHMRRLNTDPTGEPSGIPTGIPTEWALTRTPTGLPTLGPSDVPSGRPSGPTGSPSGSPSGRPTCVPSDAPSSPTGQRSDRPTGKPTGKPTSRPSNFFQQTRIPSSAPSGDPTGIPTLSEPDVLVLSVSQNLVSSTLTAEIFNQDKYLTPFRKALASITGVRASDVNVTEVTTLLESRRRLTSGDIIGVTVDYEITATVQEIMVDDSADFDAAIAQISDALTNSASVSGDGRFMDALVAEANNYGDASVATVFGSTSVSEPDQVTVNEVGTPEPTLLPTGAPSLHRHNSSDDEGMSVTLLIFLPLLALAVLIGCGGPIYCQYRESAKIAAYDEQYRLRPRADSDATANSIGSGGRHGYGP